MSHNRRLIIGVLSIVLLTFMLGYSVQAALPIKQGNIIDEAAMLTNEQKLDIEKAIEAASIDFYLYTVPSLQGESISTLGQSIFESWSLAENDVLMIIADEDREVHFEAYANSPLDKALSSLPSNYGGIENSNPYTGFLDRHFIPHAVNGDFDLGIIEMLEELSALIPAVSDPVEETEEEVNQVTTPSIPPPAQETNQPDSQPPAERSDSGANTAANVIIFLVFAFFSGGIFTGVIAIKRFLSRRKLLRLKNKLATDLQAILIKIHQVEQDLKPIVKFSRGKSEAYLKESKEKFYELLQAATKLNHALDQFSIPFWSQKSVEAQLNAYIKQGEDFNQEISEISAKVEFYKQTEKEIAPVVQRCKNDLNQAETLLERQLNELRYPLVQLVSRKDALKNTVQEAVSSVQFDPLHVKKLLEGVPENITELKREIELTAIQTEEFKQLPNKLIASRQTIDELVKSEQLILTEIDPYSVFDRIQEQQSRLERSLQLGDIGTSTAILKRINEWLAIALEKVNKSIATRDWSLDTLSQIEIDVRKYNHEGISVLRTEIAKVQQKYHPVHWEKHLEELQLASSNHLEINQQIPQVKHCLDSKVQKYFEAQNILNDMLQLLDENNKIEQKILKLKPDLDEQAQQLEKDHEELTIKFSHALSRIQLHKIHMVTVLQEMETEIRDVFGDIAEILQEPTLHVKEYELATKQASRCIHQFEGQIEATVQVKNKAEKSYSELSTSFANAMKRYRAKINRSFYNSAYKEIDGRIQLALKQGEYEQAMVFIDEGNALISRMGHDYQQQVNLEHQKAMERQHRLAMEREHQRNLQRIREEQEAKRRNSPSIWDTFSSGSSSSGRTNSSGSSSSSWSSSSGGSSSWGKPSGGSSGFSKSNGGGSSWSSTSKSSGSKGGSSKGGSSKW